MYWGSWKLDQCPSGTNSYYWLKEGKRKGIRLPIQDTFAWIQERMCHNRKLKHVVDVTILDVNLDQSLIINPNVNRFHNFDLNLDFNVSDAISEDSAFSRFLYSILVRCRVHCCFVCFLLVSEDTCLRIRPRNITISDDLRIPTSVRRPSIQVNLFTNARRGQPPSWKGEMEIVTLREPEWNSVQRNDAQRNREVFEFARSFPAN